MEIFTFNGEIFDELPGILNLPNGTTISPVTREVFLAKGGTIEDDGRPTHKEELDACCDKFIEIVLEIANKIGDPTFMGGVDIEEQEKFLNSDFVKNNPTEALILSQRWNGANLACNYIANKPDVNMPSPVWYYYAWQRYAEKQGK